MKRQEKLQRGVLDDDTRSVMETCSKRAPEKNLKNNTYFIKAEQSEMRLPTTEDDSYIVEEGIDVSGMKSQDEELISKIDKDLKETREFIQKFDKYSHITKKQLDPERLLQVHESIKSKPTETNAESVLRRGAASKTNKSSTKKLQQTKTCGIQNKSLQEITKNLAVSSQSRVADEKSRTGVQKEVAEQDSFERMRKIAEKDSDIAGYFSSLNRIEDTIKFLEQNMANAEVQDNHRLADIQSQSNTEANEFKCSPLRDTVLSTDKKKDREPFAPLDINDFFDGSPVPKSHDDGQTNESLHLKESLKPLDNHPPIDFEHLSSSKNRQLPPCVKVNQTYCYVS